MDMFHGRTPRRKIPALLALLSLIIAAFVLLVSYQENFLVFTIGPYKGSLLVFSVVFSVFFFDWAISGMDRNQIGAWSAIFVGVGWLISATIVPYRFPAVPLAALLQKWSFVGFILILWGIGMRFRFAIADRLCQNGSVLEKISLFLALGFLLWTLLPVLQSGFYWDDAMFSVQIPALRIDGGSIWQRTWDEIVNYAARGRINPFATFQFLTFYFFPSAILYKGLLIALTLLNAFLFYRFAVLFSRKSTGRILGVLILALCVQLRIYHDPMTGYYGLMQMMFAELMLALIWLIRFLTTGRKGWLIASLTLFAVGLMSYEMFYPMILLVMIVVWRYRESFWQRIRSLFPYAVLAAVLLSLSMILRADYAAVGETYAGTEFSLNLPKILETWWFQTSAAFPLSYRLADYDATIRNRLIFTDSLFQTAPIDILRSVRWQDVAGAFVLMILSLDQMRRLKNERVPLSDWLFGLSLLLCSGMVISLSQKYQFELNPGIAYLPVWFGYFGAAWLLMCLIFWLVNKRAVSEKLAPLSIFIAASFAVVYLLNQQSALQVIERLNESFLYARRTGEAALQSGILTEANVSDGGTLIPNHPDFLWEAGWDGAEARGSFYALHSGSEVNVLSPTEYFSVSGSEMGDSSQQNTFVIQYAGERTAGFAKIGKLINSGGLTAEGVLENPIARDVFFFYAGKNLDSLVISWTGWNGQGHQLPLKEAWLIQETPQGRLYKLDFPNAVVFNTIGVTRYQ